MVKKKRFDPEFKVLSSYRVDEPYGLVELQKNEWDPVLQWAKNR